MRMGTGVAVAQYAVSVAVAVVVAEEDPNHLRCYAMKDVLVDKMRSVVVARVFGIAAVVVADCP